MSFTFSAREEAKRSTASQGSTNFEEGFFMTEQQTFNNPTMSVVKTGTISQIAQDILALSAGKTMNSRQSVATSNNASAFSQMNMNNATTTMTVTTQGTTDYSEVEAAILKATMPFTVEESETITVCGETGVWANKAELMNWRGVIPLTEYLINEDSNPEIIRKRTEQQLIYEQEIAVRYLRPPTPPPPGEIHIREEKNIPTPPAPPMVIRQQPPRPETPAPLVVREAPPQPPAQVGAKVITISGKRLPPPPRKVVIERLAPLPSKPQSVIIERWLPYNEQKRRVIFQKNTVPDPIVQKSRNVIIQWEAPSVTIKKEFRDLGVIRANPVEYVQKYGVTLKNYTELPEFVREIRPPTGVVLAAEYKAPAVMELEGDVQALQMIDLEREGLSQYSFLLKQFNQRMSMAAGSRTASFAAGQSAGFSSSQSAGFTTGQSTEFSTGGQSAYDIINAILTEIFASIDLNQNSQITMNEAEKLMLILNSRLGRQYGEDDAKMFFTALDKNHDGHIDFKEFKAALVSNI